MKKCSILFLCLALVFSLNACASRNTGKTAGTAASQEGKLKVSVTFDAMKEFAAAVGGNRVKISTIIPDGTEPHDFEPKAQDLKSLNSASVFIYNGFGMEAWADQAVSAADNPKLVVVEASKGADPIANTDKGAITEHGQYDPHLWLSLKGAKIEAENIRDGLIKADPDHAAEYRKNCSGFVGKLQTLYQEYSRKFQTVNKKSIVTGHAAFGYLCRDFGLTQNSVEDVFAEGEPSAQQLAELIKYCRKNQVKTIFAEELASPEVSRTLADEVGAKVKTIYTIESTEGGKTYLERVSANLAEIYESLR